MRYTGQNLEVTGLGQGVRPVAEKKSSKLAYRPVNLRLDEEQPEKVVPVGEFLNNHDWDFVGGENGPQGMRFYWSKEGVDGLFTTAEAYKLQVRKNRLSKITERQALANQIRATSPPPMKGIAMKDEH